MPMVVHGYMRSYIPGQRRRTYSNADLRDVTDCLDWDGKC
jgi:hypothetical protein